NVRGEVVLKSPTSLSGSPSAQAVYEELVYKAYFRARFPSFRITAGKTRLSWGDGMLFNAGDVLYGSNDTSVTLTQSELRSKTSLLIALNYPLGFFSFAEGVMLPSEDGNPNHMGFGSRLYTTIRETKVEGGFLSKIVSGERLHKPYISLQGNIGPDWYLSSSLAIPQNGNVGQEIRDSWVITGGIYHIQALTNERNLTFRLEFLTRPFGNWKAESQSDDTCPLLVYPEITFNPNSSLSWSFRSIISPLDFSFNASLGVNWAVFEGFSLIGYLSSPFGDEGDLFSWKGQIPSPYGPIDARIALTFGASWIF
ncbi:MAG: hypothetical protein ACQ5SW_04595, partial [Sphaerochaetaceae bacterium]